MVQKTNILNLEELPDPTDKFELLEVIGEGTYGEVHLATDLSDGETKVAIKILENLVENMEEAEKEFIVLRDLSLHPNLPAFYGLYFKRLPKLENSQFWFVMELCNGGSITDLSQGLRKYENRQLKELQIAFILKEVLDALIHLHQNKCIHRDVKGHNILLTSEGTIKLIDFGVSSHVEESSDRRNTAIGTPFYMSPEVIACERQADCWYDSRCDVWSLGITAIELADGEPPLAELHPMRALFQIPRNPPPTLSKPDQWSSNYNDFVSECLIKDMEERPHSIELQEHPFLTQLDPIMITDVKKELIKEIELIKAFRTGTNFRREPEVTTKNGKLKTDRRSKLQTMMVDDLASLSSLDEETILDQLYNRFMDKQPYTFIGDILLAVNPYEDVGIYSDFHQYKYRGAGTADMSPHIFGMADQAYHSMLHLKKPQSIVISGESGSGKTESANFLLQQLVYLGKAPNRNLEAKILGVNPIMEAFGNAATAMNTNSSRFGKYLDVTFTKTGKVTGSRISVYLLEESRVVHQAMSESNFHIFYYLMDGLDAAGLREEFQLTKGNYKYLRCMEASKEPKKYRIQNFEAVINGFHTIGFRTEEIFVIYQLLSAILHLGEIEFVSGIDEDCCSVDNSKDLEAVAAMLGLSSGDLGICLTTRSVVTRGESFLRRHSILEAQTTRDSLAKGLYNRVFKWIVHQINALLGISRLAYGDPLSIGILDIFGFEYFEHNSLEQMCINITNEQLQYYFNQHVFAWEQQEYMAEGIDINVVCYADNRPILDLFMGRPVGILTLLDEESKFQRATDSSLLDKLNSNLKENKYYFPDKSSASKHFMVRHYNGKVTYEVKDFLKKNRNWESQDLTQLLMKSEVELVSILYRSYLSKTGFLYFSQAENPAIQVDPLATMTQTSKINNSVAYTFRHSLADLMSKLLSGDPYFIKCIKPNNGNLSGKFDHIKVLSQLRNEGILEAVKIRQSGFSHRYNFAAFLRNYCFLAFNFDERVVADKESCRLLLLRLKLDGWALGRTKVFLKYYHVEYLSKLCEQQIRSIVFVQSCVRRWLAKIRVENNTNGMWGVAHSIVSAQKASKVWRGRRKASDIFSKNQHLAKKRKSLLRARLMGEIVEIADEEKAATIIQSRVRGFLARKKYGKVLEERIKQIVATHATQESAREALKDEGLEEEEAAVVLQRFYRRWKVTKDKKEDEEEEAEEVEEREKKEEKDESEDAWDAPFKMIESQMRDERKGIKREKVDMVAHRKDLIRAGLESQDLKNLERQKEKMKGWDDVITQPGTEGPDVSWGAGKRISKFNKQILSQALEKKVVELRKMSVDGKKLRKNSNISLDGEKGIKSLASLVKQQKRDSIGVRSPSPREPKETKKDEEIKKCEANEKVKESKKNGDSQVVKEKKKLAPKAEGKTEKVDNQSLIDFRKSLRKTGCYPTDSLKKGQSWSSPMEEEE